MTPQIVRRNINLFIDFSMSFYVLQFELLTVKFLIDGNFVNTTAQLLFQFSFIPIEMGVIVRILLIICFPQKSKCKSQTYKIDFLIIVCDSALVIHWNGYHTLRRFLFVSVSLLPFFFDRSDPLCIWFESLADGGKNATNSENLSIEHSFRSFCVSSCHTSLFVMLDLNWFSIKTTLNIYMIFLRLKEYMRVYWKWLR